jgi:hypothetical protein
VIWAVRLNADKQGRGRGGGRWWWGGGAAFDPAGADSTRGRLEVPGAGWKLERSVDRAESTRYRGWPLHATAPAAATAATAAAKDSARSFCNYNPGTQDNFIVLVRSCSGKAQSQPQGPAQATAAVLSMPIVLAVQLTNHRLSAPLFPFLISHSKAQNSGPCAKGGPCLWRLLLVFVARVKLH